MGVVEIVFIWDGHDSFGPDAWAHMRLSGCGVVVHWSEAAAATAT